MKEATMPKFSQHGLRNASIGLLIILLISIVGAVVWIVLSDDEPESHLAEMHIEVGYNNGDDQYYCADFIADEVGQNQIEVTITNCGDTAFKIKHGKARTKLAASKEYSVKLPAGVKHFNATVTTLKGTFLGKFSF